MAPRTVYGGTRQTRDFGDVISGTQSGLGAYQSRLYSPNMGGWGAAAQGRYGAARLGGEVWSARGARDIERARAKAQQQLGELEGQKPEAFRSQAEQLNKQNLLTSSYGKQEAQKLSKKFEKGAKDIEQGLQDQVREIQDYIDDKNLELNSLLADIGGSEQERQAEEALTREGWEQSGLGL